jgi:hypothetical protein
MRDTETRRHAALSNLRLAIIPKKWYRRMQEMPPVQEVLLPREPHDRTIPTRPKVTGSGVAEVTVTPRASSKKGLSRSTVQSAPAALPRRDPPPLLMPSQAWRSRHQPSCRALLASNLEIISGLAMSPEFPLLSSGSRNDSVVG